MRWHALVGRFGMLVLIAGLTAAVGAAAATHSPGTAVRVGAVFALLAGFAVSLVLLGAAPFRRPSGGGLAVAREPEGRR
jgi:predicted phage tail protein